MTGDASLEADDAEVIWCIGQRERVAAYLRSQRLLHGEIGEWPAWHLMPYCSLWVVESLSVPGAIGWWVICGDMPSDYVSSKDVPNPQHPRKAMRVFAQTWLRAVEAWKADEEVDNFVVGTPENRAVIMPALEKRAHLLFDFANQDEWWNE